MYVSRVGRSARTTVGLGNNVIMLKRLQKTYCGNYYNIVSYETLTTCFAILGYVV